MKRIKKYGKKEWIKAGFKTKEIKKWEKLLDKFCSRTGFNKLYSLEELYKISRELSPEEAEKWFDNKVFFLEDIKLCKKGKLKPEEAYDVLDLLFSKFKYKMDDIKYLVYKYNFPLKLIMLMLLEIRNNEEIQEHEHMDYLEMMIKIFKSFPALNKYMEVKNEG